MALLPKKNNSGAVAKDSQKISLKNPLAHKQVFTHEIEQDEKHYMIYIFNRSIDVRASALATLASIREHERTARDKRVARTQARLQKAKTWKWPGVNKNFLSSSYYVDLLRLTYASLLLIYAFWLLIYSQRRHLYRATDALERKYTFVSGLFVLPRLLLLLVLIYLGLTSLL